MAQRFVESNLVSRNLKHDISRLMRTTRAAGKFVARGVVALGEAAAGRMAAAVEGRLRPLRARGPSPPAQDELAGHGAGVAEGAKAAGSFTEPRDVRALSCHTLGALGRLSLPDKVVIIRRLGDRMLACPGFRVKHLLFDQLAASCGQELAAADVSLLISLALALRPLVQQHSNVAESATALLDKVFRECWRRVMRDTRLAAAFGPVVVLCSGVGSAAAKRSRVSLGVAYFAFLAHADDERKFAEDCKMQRLSRGCDTLTARKAVVQVMVKRCLDTQEQTLTKAAKRQLKGLPEGFILASGSSFSAEGLAVTRREASKRRLAAACRLLPPA